MVPEPDTSADACTVLVVDEDRAARSLVESALRDRGLRVLCADSATEAVRRIEEDRPALVLCDVYLPDRDGYLVCDFVKSHPALAATPVLLMADVVDRVALARAARVGAEDVARKPAAADDLLGRIEGLLSLTPATASATDSKGSISPDAPETLIAALAAIPGVSLVALVDHEGFLLGPADETGEQTELVCALAACLAESSEVIGHELGQGTVRSLTLEYASGFVFLSGLVAPATRLAVMLKDPTALAAIRRALASLPAPDAVLS